MSDEVNPAAGIVPKYWTGPPGECDFRNPGDGLEHQMSVFVDGRTKHGPWANMCERCFVKHGVGLGTGSGQKYARQVDGRWLKTEG